MTQLAFVQEHALAEAQNRIQRLEWELQQAQQAAQQAQEQQGAARGGFFSGLFGGGSRLGAATAAGWRRDRPGTRVGRSRAMPNYQQGAATAATICAELPAGHVPALRLRVPGLGADHRGRRGRRSGCRQCADEPVLRLARGGGFGGAGRRAAVRGAVRRRTRAMWTRAPGQTRPAAARRIRAMSIAAPGTPRQRPVPS